MAGKTGTARIPLEGARGYKDGVYASSFAGFVPAAAPALTGIVILDDTAQFGATSAAPTFASIARYGLQEFQVPPNATIPLVPGVPVAHPRRPGRGFGRDGSDPFGDAGHDPIDGAGQGDHPDLGDGQQRCHDRPHRLIGTEDEPPTTAPSSHATTPTSSGPVDDDQAGDDHADHRVAARPRERRPLRPRPSR